MAKNVGVALANLIDEFALTIVQQSMQDSKFRMAFPVISQGTWTTDELRQTTLKSTGTAKIISDYSDDLPSSDLWTTRESYPLRIVGSSYEFSFAEKGAVVAGSNVTVDSTRASEAIQSHERYFNYLAWKGAPQHGINGIMDSGIPIVPAQTLGGNTTWITKTPQEVKSEFTNYIINAVEDASDDEITPNRFLMSKSVYDQISGIYMHNLSDKTLLQSIIESLVSNGTIQSGADIIPLKQLNNAGPSNSNVLAAMYARESSIAFNISEQPQTLTAVPSDSGLYYRVPYVSQTSGLIVRKKNDHAILFGI